MFCMISEFIFIGDVYINGSIIEVSLNSEKELILLKANGQYYITRLTFAVQDIANLFEQICPKKVLNPRAKEYIPKVNFN
jgi:hypothetical protein